MGFVGNLAHVKRADKLPEIFHGVSKIIPNVYFIVVGDGPLKEIIEERTKDLKITFTGRVKPGEVPYYMNAMDVMILPSRNKGFGCVVLEAQACGVPVVGSDNGGIPEAIGNGGTVIPDGQNFEEHFAKSVVAMLNNPIPSSKLRSRVLMYD